MKGRAYRASHTAWYLNQEENKMDYVIAFVVGGAICALCQILMEKTKMMPGRIMVLLVCLGAVLGAVGLYEPFAKWAKAGANVPLLGFGNNLWKGVKEMVDKEGLPFPLSMSLMVAKPTPAISARSR